jgi:hypothetical protein
MMSFDECQSNESIMELGMSFFKCDAEIIVGGLLVDYR